MSNRAFHIYTLTNTVNGKLYVGQSIHPKTRFQDHLCAARSGSEFLIHRAMRKYGVESFVFEVIETCDTKERSDALEQSWITRLNSRSDADGYNVTAGGDGTIGYRHTEESKMVMSLAASGRIVSAETRAKMAAKMRGNSHAKGNKLSAETVAKMSAVAKGNTHALGYKHTPETLAQISAASMGNSYARGYRHTPDALARMAESSRNRHRGELERSKLSASKKEYWRAAWLARLGEVFAAIAAAVALDQSQRAA